MVEIDEFAELKRCDARFLRVDGVAAHAHKSRKIICDLESHTAAGEGRDRTM